MDLPPRIRINFFINTQKIYTVIDLIIYRFKFFLSSMVELLSCFIVSGSVRFSYLRFIVIFLFFNDFRLLPVRRKHALKRNYSPFLIWFWEDKVSRKRISSRVRQKKFDYCQTILVENLGSRNCIYSTNLSIINCINNIDLSSSNQQNN